MPYFANLRRLLLSAVFCVVIASAAQAKWLTALADRIKIAIPEDYVVTDKHELDELFEEDARPIVHATSPDEVVEVAAFYHATVDFPAAVIDDMLGEFKKAYPVEMPSMKWIKSETRTIGGTKVVYLEFSHTEGDSPLTLIQVIFPDQGKMAMVQLACDTGEYGARAGTLKKIVDNLKFGG